MRIAVLHNEPRADSSEDDADVLAQVAAISEALQALGHDYVTLGCTLDLERVQSQLRASHPDIVFNVVEALGGTDRLQTLAPMLLEAEGIPYTGCPLSAMMLANGKIIAKEHMRAAGLPTPRHVTSLSLRRPSHSASLGVVPLSANTLAPTTPAASTLLRISEWSNQLGCTQFGPLTPSLSPEYGARGGKTTLFSSPSSRMIIKAEWEHASFAMDDSIILPFATPEAIQAELMRREQQTGRPFFAEEYIEGREFNVSLLASESPGLQSPPQVLPPAEIDFSALPKSSPHIVGYAAKWQVDSYEYHHTPRTFSCHSDDRALFDQLQLWSIRAWQVFGLRGFARVDFRVDWQGRPWILEINTNPCLSPDAGFQAALAEAGISFPSAIARILTNCNSP